MSDVTLLTGELRTHVMAAVWRLERATFEQVRIALPTRRRGPYFSLRSHSSAKDDDAALRAVGTRVPAASLETAASAWMRHRRLVRVAEIGVVSSSCRAARSQRGIGTGSSSDPNELGPLAKSSRFGRSSGSVNSYHGGQVSSSSTVAEARTL